MMTTIERQQVLVEWNRTAKDYQRDKCVHQLFEEQVERTPDAIAVVFEGLSLTYRELNARANQLGHHLRSLGVGPDVLVGLFVERSLDMVVGLLGILKAGGAYVPLDPDYPADRVAFMIEDATVRVLLTQSYLEARLPPHAAQRVVLDRDWEEISGESQVKPRVEVTSTNLVYMIYTSGSTGRPKGAFNEHRGVCNRLFWMQDEYCLGPEDVVLQKTPFSFDVSVWEFFWPLMAGARLVMVKPGAHKDAAYLVQFIRDQCVTTLHFVPPMLRIFLEEPQVGNCRTLRHVVCSGEALPHELQEKFFSRLDAQLHNLYGPTEAAVDVTHWTCRRDSHLRIVPIGRPVANTQCYILDDQLQPVPVGTPGQLHLGGVQVGRGYHNRPELTAERFIADSFSSEPGARLYKTGDLARHLPDGNIEFLGRIDSQVKIRGHRIELGEIEAVLGGHPELAVCTVVAQSHGDTEKVLAAFVVEREHVALSVASLRIWLREKLPDYMIPSRFFVLPALPLTHNGKVDRKALERMDGAELAPGTDHVPPRTELESKLVEIWQTVLRRERIGIRDNFFHLGGDSLHLIQLALLIEQQWRQSVPVATLRDVPILSQMAAVLDQLGKTEVTPEPTVPATPLGSTTHTAVYLPDAYGVGFFRPAYKAALGGLVHLVDGFQLPGLAAEEVPLVTVDACVDFLLPQLWQCVPTGPLHLVGYSFGAYLALELARRLQAEGRTVDTVFLIDAVCPTSLKKLSLWGSLAIIWDHLWNHGARHRKLSVSNRIRQWLDAGLTSRLSWVRRIFSRINSRSNSVEYPLFMKMMQAATVAETGYAPEPYAGRVVVLRACGLDPCKSVRHTSPDATNGWGPIVRGSLEVVAIPGCHGTVMLEPNVTVQAAALQKCLQARVAATA